MEYLPAEIQLKILKNLNFDELLKIKRTNKYFYYFINKYKDELARKEFEELLFKTSDFSGLCEVSIKSELFHSNFVRNFMVNDPLSNQLRQKWLSAIDKKIPVFLVDTAISDKSGPLLYYIKGNSEKKEFYLELPFNPKNIEEFQIVRYWLKQLFRCTFEFIHFEDFIFNPEMIKLLFDNEEINKLKFNCESAYINIQNIDVLKFTLDCLVISENLDISFEEVNTTGENNNFLFNLLSNEGHRIPKICLDQSNYNQIALYNNLINHIETSKDLSKMVNKIRFCWNNLLRSELIIRGIEMNESSIREKYYKIKNIHNSKIMFIIIWSLNDSNFINYIKINRVI